MCGIAGILTCTPGPDLEQDVRAMTSVLQHRGPDGEGTWLDLECGIGFGQRRLSIIDLSSAGDQPMSSACGRYTINYNGEVYNAVQLSDELKARGRTFRGHSDTEVVIEAIAAWGIEATVKRLIGMFAIALWDAKERKLHLIRDRLGIKPLYWSICNGTLLFASELKSLVAHRDFNCTVDRNAVVSYLRLSYIPAPLTIYAHAQKLEPGRIMTVTAGGAPTIDRYWSLDDAVSDGLASQLEMNDEEAIDQLDGLLGDAVAMRMISDVPYGAFLSGGIDSSTVAALMQRASTTPVKTFSIGFSIDDYNEADAAAAVARHLGTNHTELYVEPDIARDVIPRLPAMYDEPFADSSQIPTHLVSAMARKHVTVALSGDGGDEVFTGYNRYVHAALLRRYLMPLPRFVRTATATAIEAVPVRIWDGLIGRLPVLSKQRTPGDKVHKIASILHEDKENIYRRLVSQWPEPNRIALRGQEVTHPLWERANIIAPDLVDRMQYLDTMTYLPDDILTKVDRASMAVSLEARVPLLDHRVVEFAWRLPRHFKLRNGQSKWLLRQVLKRYVPESLVNRPKSGFGVPIHDWLRGPLRDWAETLLSPAALNRHNLVRPDAIQEKLREHLDGRRNWQHILWNILMLQAWCEEWS